MRIFLKTSWDIEPRNGGFILTETTKATGAAATGSIEFGPFETRAEAEKWAAMRQEGLGEMLARMRAQITLAMREGKAA